MNRQDWTDLMNNLGEQYGKLEEHPFIRPEFADWLKEKAKMLFVEPIMAAGNLTKHAMRNPLYAEQHPLETMSVTAMALGGGFPFAPEGEATVGTIKGLGRGPEAKALRDMLATENRLRKGEGPLAGNWKWEGQREWNEQNPWFRDTLEGTWLHGRRTFPETGERFFGARQKKTNVGEPSGISLSTRPEIAASNFAKVTDKKKAILTDLAELADITERNVGIAGNLTPHYKLVHSKQRLLNQTKFGRVKPMYGEPGPSSILPAWKTPDTEWAQNIIADAYTKAAKQTMSLHRDTLLPKIQELVANKGTNTEAINTGIKYHFGTSDYQRDFNRLFTENLRAEGVKGLLYSPQRYGEYELRMLDPSDVMMLDKRTAYPEWDQFDEVPKKRSLAPFYKTFKNPKKKPWYATLYPEDRYNSSLGSIYAEKVDLKQAAEQAYPDIDWNPTKNVGLPPFAAVRDSTGALSTKEQDVIDVMAEVAADPKVSDSLIVQVGKAMLGPEYSAGKMPHLLELAKKGEGQKYSDEYLLKIIHKAKGKP